MNNSTHTANMNKMLKISMISSLLVVALAVTIAMSASPPDLKETTNKNQNSTSPPAAINVEARTKPEQELTGNLNAKKEQSITSARGGRMLDLDHLAGDIGKGEKLAKERSISGDRQSRILSVDVLPEATGSGPTEQRTKKSKGKKKMAIKGFIPIVSLEHSKDGKNLEDSLVDNDSEGEEEEQENEQQQPYAASQTKEQLLSSYGGQTSIGHASFGVQPQELASQQQTANNGWQQMQATDYNQEAGRARKLLGSSGILSGLTTPGRKFVSSLIPNAPPFNQMPSLQGPMNVPSQMMMMAAQQDECICVPFFQCKNGYLTESQLTKSQIVQYQQNPVHHAQTGYQIPRAINLNEMVSKTDLTIEQQQQIQQLQQLQQQQQQQVSNPTAQSYPLYQGDQYQQLLMSQQQQQQQATGSQLGEQQNVNDMIYEQLRKTIESNNLEQQLLQQQSPAYMGLDERSKGSGEVRKDNGTQKATIETEEVEERSLLNPLGRRNSAQRSCGIMRTCCKVPPHLTAHRAQRFNQQQLQNQRLVSGQRPHGAQSPQQAQYQMLQPASSHQSYQTLSSLNANANNNYDLFGNPQFPAQQTQLQQQQQQQHQQQLQDYQIASTLASPSSQQHSLVPTRSGFMAGRCGVRQTMGISGRVQNTQPAPGSETTAEFGEFPSHVAILKRLSQSDSMFVCSAVLISNQWIATASHCVRKHRPEELKVRLGEWDVNRDDEFYPHVETSIRDILIHPDFQPSSLINDIALLRLEQAVDPQQMPHIAPACLPTSEELFDGQRCWVAGWGKDAFGQQGTFQNVLKKVDLPIVNRQTCENSLRYGTKLGKFFRLHQSAICAGGERGKDACEGDGGAGLYCHDPESGLTKVAGLVSWGIGCGQKGIPGVYTNLASLGSWIEQVVSNSGEENLYANRNSVLSENLFKSVISERNINGNNNGNSTTL